MILYRTHSVGKIIFLTTLISFIAGYIFNQRLKLLIYPVIEKATQTNEEKPLEVYQIDNLKAADIKAGVFTITETLSDNKSFDASLFSFKFNPNPSNKYSKTTTGIINIPKKADFSKFPLVILIRGFVDQSIYASGMGTNRVGEYLAQNGHITVAPDFLGYAKSDGEAGNIFESRFQTYTTILSLLKSVNQIPNFDQKNIFLWGHSNGGQIALTVLEITGNVIPTVLWAPVSKPFPYSILFYTDESSDRGKFIRKQLSVFENLYDAEKYSLDNYLQNINAPMQIHQGTNDDAVLPNWTINLCKNLDFLNKDITCIYHNGADHNLKPAWNKAVSESLDFFRKNQ